MTSLRSKLLSAAAGVAIAGFASSASAAPISFDFNVAGSNFFVGPSNLGSSLNNITQLGFDQTTNTTIFQSNENGNFIDNGSLTITTFTPTVGTKTAFGDFGPTPTFTPQPLTLQYSLTGTDVGGFLSFTTGGLVNLFQGASNVATFKVIPPSGSTTALQVTNGKVGTLSLGLNLIQTLGPSNLITDTLGNSLEGISIDVATAQPQFNGTAGGGVVSPVTCPLGLDNTLGCSEFTTSALPGTIEVETAVPEPGILSVFGLSLLGFAFIRRGSKAA
jgi:hypothetical protein